MSKKIFQIMSVIVAFALTFGSFYNVGASSTTAPQLAVTTYYVATTGNDANAGTSAAPFKTIQKCANAAVSGAVCSVAAGTYAERVSVTRAGIGFQGNGLVTMQGFQISADNVSVRGFYITGMASTLVGLTVSAKTCVIENNHVYYAPRGGISLESSSSGCVVKNNKLEKNSQWGISVDGTNHTVDGNEIWNTIQYHPQWVNPPSWVDADGIRFFGTGHVIRNNYIHDIKFDATYNKTAHIDCFQTWTPGTANVLFEGNKCEEMYIHMEASGAYMKAQGFMIEGGAHDITIRNNVINAYRSINLGDPDDASTTNNINILNNTFVGAIPVQLGREEYGVFITKATNVTVKNNIFFNIIGPAFIGTVNGSYNLFYRADGQPLSGSAKTGDLWNVNPLLTGDYHLTASSPAIGKAQGGGDMGAFPFSGTPAATATLVKTSTPTAAATLTFTATPIASPVAASPTPTASSISPSVTPMASLVPASPTPTVAVQISATATTVPNSPTPIPATATASSVPVLPTLTSTSVPPSATAIRATATASAVPVLPTATSVPSTDVAPPPSLTGSEKIYYDKHSSFVYSADWRNVALAQSSGGSFKKTNEDGSTITFTFTGQSFSVLYTSGTAYGQVKVYIDGALVGTIDEYGSKTIYQKRWNYTKQLALGKHTLKLVTVGNLGRKGSLDAVIVR